MQHFYLFDVSVKGMTNVMTQQKHSGESFMKQKETRLYQKEENIPIYPLSILVDGEEAISPTSICFPVFYYLGNRETRHERAIT